MQVKDEMAVLIGALLAVVIAATPVRAMQCPVKAGESVSLMTPEAAYEILLQANPEKHEFETSAEYEARRQSGSIESGTGSTFTIEGTYDSKYAKYNADSGLMFVAEYAWDNVGVGWQDAGRIGQDITSHSNVLGVGLNSEEISLGTFQARTATGTQVTVVELQRTIYAIFDRVLTRHTSSSEQAKSEWKTQGQEQFENIMVSGIRVRMDRDKARDNKPTMRVGIVIHPKEPFTDTGTRYWEPTLDNPREVFQLTRFIVGDILCALIMDEDARVLATVTP